MLEGVLGEACLLRGPCLGRVASRCCLAVLLLVWCLNGGLLLLCHSRYTTTRVWAFCEVYVLKYNCSWPQYRVCFCVHRCGGFGYGHVLRTVPARLRRLGVSLDDIAAITTANTRRLLDWYTPPPPPEIPKDYLPCSWCGTRFEPVEGEYFHKFQFVYCGIKCLRAHRDGGFKELGDREGKTSTR